MSTKVTGNAPGVTIKGGARAKLRDFTRARARAQSPRLMMANPARKLSVAANMFVLDDEWGTDETVRQHFANAMHLAFPDMPQAPVTFMVHMGGEIRVELDVLGKITDQAGNMIVDVELKLFEGTEESTDDLDGQKALRLYVPVDQTVNHYFRVNNDDEGGDYVTVTLTLANGSP